MRRFGRCLTYCRTVLQSLVSLGRSRYVLLELYRCTIQNQRSSVSELVGSRAQVKEQYETNSRDDVRGVSCIFPTASMFRFVSTCFSFLNIIFSPLITLLTPFPACLILPPFAFFWFCHRRKKGGVRSCSHRKRPADSGSISYGVI